MIDIQEVPFGGEWYLKALVVRHAVLRAPLGRNYTLEELALDVGHRHLVACQNDDVLATITLALDAGGYAQLRQVAVAPQVQGQGIGSTLARHAENVARESGATHAFLNSRMEIVPFYTRLGYIGEGDAVTLVGLPHQRMVKAL